jgi:Predicted pyridoxal phosphate-dependent enzyme apparently involved in regulation of cell wall biogenesis
MVQGEFRREKTVTKLIKPYISFDEVAEEFKKVFDSGWFTKGPNVDLFKKELQAYTGAKHAHFTTSATTALAMCLKLLDIKQGDEVIVSDFSFPATANVVEDLYAVPVFADVDPETFNMRPEELERRITRRTKAVIFVDALGNPSGIARVKEICAARGIPLIEDAACALGSSDRGVHCGAISDLTCFSFHPRKLLSTGEGGAITTDREDWHEELKIKLEHGAKAEAGKFDFIEYGYNYRLPELQAVMGIVQVKKLDSIVASRRTLREEFSRRLAPAGYRPQSVASGVDYNVQSLVYVVPDGVDRDALVAHLKAREVEATLGTYCLSGCTYFRNRYHDVQPVAERLQRTTITLPCHDAVDPDRVCETILEYSIRG